MYITLKVVHIVSAILSIGGFFIRGLWMMRDSPNLERRWVKVLPHVNDTILLLSAIALVIATQLYPGPITWINAKIIALLLYIGLGLIALSYGKTKFIRIVAWCSALATFGYIFLVAVNKNVIPF